MNYRDDFLDSLPPDHRERAALAWDRGVAAVTDDPTAIVEAFSESDDDQLKRVGKQVVRLMESDTPITHTHTNAGALVQTVYRMMAPYIARSIEDYAKANIPDE